MKQEIIADLSRITEEEQAILDGKTEVEKERYSSGQKFVMDAGKLLERGKLIDIRPHTRFIRFPAHSHNYVEMIYMCQGSGHRPCRFRAGKCSAGNRTGGA